MVKRCGDSLGESVSEQLPMIVRPRPRTSPRGKRLRLYAGKQFGTPQTDHTSNLVNYLTHTRAADPIFDTNENARGPCHHSEKDSLVPLVVRTRLPKLQGFPVLATKSVEETCAYRFIKISVCAVAHNVPHVLEVNLLVVDCAEGLDHRGRSYSH